MRELSSHIFSDELNCAITRKNRQTRASGAPISFDGLILVTVGEHGEIFDVAQLVRGNRSIQPFAASGSKVARFCRLAERTHVRRALCFILLFCEDIAFCKSQLLLRRSASYRCSVHLSLLIAPAPLRAPARAPLCAPRRLFALRA